MLVEITINFLNSIINDLECVDDDCPNKNWCDKSVEFLNSLEDALSCFDSTVNWEEKEKNEGILLADIFNKLFSKRDGDNE
jgi:hypothetical protein